MKRLLCLCLVLILLFSGCMQSGGKSGLVTFYYRSSDETFFSELGILAAEERELSWNQTGLSGFLELYMQGPGDTNLISPFPETVRLLRVESTLDTVTIVLNDAAADMSTVDLRVAAGCIALTVWNYNRSYSTVILRADNKLLCGQEKLVLYPRELVLREENLEQDDFEISVYFADTKNRYLIAEERIVAAQDIAQLPMLMLNALMEGPRDSGLNGVIPSETALLGANVRNGICEVHFSGEFVENCPADELAQRMTLFSIVNSLCQIPSVDAVKLYADGARITHYGVFDLSEPLTADETMIGPVRSVTGEFDASVFLRIGGELHEFPMCLHESVELSRGEAIVQVLTNLEEKNGYGSPLPDDTQLLEMRQDGTTLSVSFNGALLEGKSESEKGLILDSIEKSLSSLDRVKYVRIFADGTEVTPPKE